MSPKRIKQKSEIFKSGFNGFTIVDYTIYNANYDNMRQGRILGTAGTALAVPLFSSHKNCFSIL